MTKYKVIVDSRYGYRRLEPLPTEDELRHFYGDQYYNLLQTGNRAPELRKLMQGGEEARAELEWLSQTLWKDVLDVLTEQGLKETKPRLLDVGCGLGHFGQYMQLAGWEVVGVEPSRDAREVACSLGIAIFNSLEECVQHVNHKFEAVTLLNVLEHVLEPADIIQKIRPLMHDKSVLVVRVPNDFSSLQEFARRKLQIEPWWITTPDHVNYFNFESLVHFLEQLDFQIVETLSDFPMELFLLFGEIYVGNPQVGSECHRKRVALELSIPSEERRKLYKCFAKHGIGRDCLVFAKPRLSD